MIYYVSAKANLNGDGTKEKPFKTIKQGSEIAAAGDGIYRE